MNETSTVFVSPDGHNNIDLNHLPPLAKGWSWHVYGSGIGQTSTRWVVHTGPVKDGFALCTYR